MTETPRPRLWVLDDWEGLVRSAAGLDVFTDEPLHGNHPLRSPLDADVVPSDGVLGGVRGSSE